MFQVVWLQTALDELADLWLQEGSAVRQDDHRRRTTTRIPALVAGRGPYEQGEIRARTARLRRHPVYPAGLIWRRHSR